MGGEDLSDYYYATFGRVWAYLFRLTRDRAAASDLAQEAFVRMIAAKRDDLPIDERTAYVFTIATNLARDRAKKASRERVMAEMFTAATVTTPEPARAIALERALASLPERQRSIVWLAYAEGFDHRTIARLVGVAEKSVKVLLFRARQKLMQILEEI